MPVRTMFKEATDDTRHRHDRLTAVTGIGMWFAASAFVISTAVFYVEKSYALDVPENAVALIGGAIIAGVATILKAI